MIFGISVQNMLKIGLYSYDIPKLHTLVPPKKRCFRFPLKCFCRFYDNFSIFWIFIKDISGPKINVKNGKKHFKGKRTSFCNRTRRTQQIIINSISLFLFDLLKWKLIKYSRKSMGVIFGPNGLREHSLST